MRKLLLPAIALAIACSEPATGQFGRLKDRLKKEAEGILDKKPAAARDTTPAPTAPPAASAPPATSVPPPASAPPAASAPAVISSGAAKKADILPDIAVDQNIVAQQQVAVREHCEKERLINKGVGCECLAQQYPQARLQRLSDSIREARRQKELTCGTDSGPSCARTTLILEQMEARDYQEKYPAVRLVLPTKRPRPLPKPQSFDSLALNPIYDQCIDGSLLANSMKETCLRQGTAPQGKSTEEYCSCLATEYQKTLEGSGKLGSDGMTQAQTAAYRKCGV